MSLITVRSPSTKVSVDLTSTPVSSLFEILGMGVSKSPCTSSFIRFTQAFIGLPILRAKTSATITEINMDIPITKILITIASRVEAR